MPAVACCLILCRAEECATTEPSSKASPWGSIAPTGSLLCIILSLGLQAQVPVKIRACFSSCPGAWKTRSWKGGDDSAASVPVHAAAAWDRHVQPKCKCAFCLLSVAFTALQLSRMVPPDLAWVAFVEGQVSAGSLLICSSAVVPPCSPAPPWSHFTLRDHSSAGGDKTNWSTFGQHEAIISTPSMMQYSLRPVQGRCWIVSLLEKGVYIFSVIKTGYLSNIKIRRMHADLSTAVLGVRCRLQDRSQRLPGCCLAQETCLCFMLILPLLHFPQGCTFRPVLSIQSHVVQLSLVCRCSVGMHTAALHVRAMTLCLKCALDIWVLVFFVSDSRTCGSVASESGSCQRQGTVGKRTQNWRYPTCGHGNIDWSIVGCDESTELSRLTFVFKGQKSIGKRLFHYQTLCNLCLYGLSLFHLVITMVLVVLSLKHQTFQGEKNRCVLPTRGSQLHAASRRNLLPGTESALFFSDFVLHPLHDYLYTVC